MLRAIYLLPQQMERKKNIRPQTASLNWAPKGGGKKGEFGDWSTTNYNLHLVRKYGRKSSANSRERRSKKAKSLLRGKNIASLFKTFDFSEFIIMLG